MRKWKEIISAISKNEKKDEKKIEIDKGNFYDIANRCDNGGVIEKELRKQKNNKNQRKTSQT